MLLFMTLTTWIYGIYESSLHVYDITVFMETVTTVEVYTCAHPTKLPNRALINAIP